MTADNFKKPLKIMVYIYIHMVYIWYIYGIYGIYIMVYIYIHIYIYMAGKYSRVKKVKNRKATKVNRRPNIYVISKRLKD